MAWWDDILNEAQEGLQRQAAARPQQQGRPYAESVMGQGQGRTPRQPAAARPRQGYTAESYYAEVRPELRNGVPSRLPGGGLPAPPTAQSSDEEILAFLQATYPYLAAFTHNPEVRNVLIQGARQGWDENRLKGALTATNWWQSTDAAQRTWQKLESEDPAEARRLVMQTAASIQNSARTLGVNMDSGAIANMARMATAAGWTDAQTIDHLVGSFSWESTPGGDMTAFRDSVKQIGAQYLVSVSEQTARDYAEKIASGEMSQQGVQSIMQRQARARFSWMGDLIDQGITPADYFAPARDVLANELEVGTDDINLMDPKWLSMLEVRDEKGQTRGATMQEAMLTARRQPEWAGTQKAQERTAGMASMLGEIFGRKGI